MTDKRPLCKNCGTRHGLAAPHAQTVTVGLGVTDNVTGRGVTRQMSRDNVTTPPPARAGFRSSYTAGACHSS